MAKRPNGEGTVFFDHKANRYRAQFYDKNGKRRGLSARTQSAIHKKLRDAITSREDGTQTSKPSDMESLGEYLDSWFETQSQTKWEFKTSEHNALDINRYIKPALGKVRLDLLTPEIITKAYVQIRKEHKLSESSMLHIHAVLKSAIKRAIMLKKIIVNPMDGVEAPKPRLGKIRVLSGKEMQTLLHMIVSEPVEWRAMWQMTLLTGLRQGEVLGLTWENVDLNSGEIRVVQQLQRQTNRGLVIKRLKTDIDGRIIILTKENIAELRKWKIEQTALKLQLQSWGEHDLVFTNSVGKPLEPRRTAKMWADLLKRSGIEHIKLHGARHSFATWAIQNGIDVKIVSHYLGHKDLRTTLKIYQQITSEGLQATSLRISELSTKGA
jgi:integrase